MTMIAPMALDDLWGRATSAGTDLSMAYAEISHEVEQPLEPLPRADTILRKVISEAVLPALLERARTRV